MVSIAAIMFIVPVMVLPKDYTLADLTSVIVELTVGHISRDQRIMGIPRH